MPQCSALKPKSYAHRTFLNGSVGIVFYFSTGIFILYSFLKMICTSVLDSTLMTSLTLHKDFDVGLCGLIKIRGERIAETVCS